MAPRAKNNSVATRKADAIVDEADELLTTSQDVPHSVRAPAFAVALGRAAAESEEDLDRLVRLARISYAASRRGGLAS